MNKKTLFIILLSIIFISGCTTQLKNCGEDEFCFKDAGSSCSKVTFTSNESEVGMIFEVKIIDEVENKCEVLVKLSKSSQLTTLEGKEALCKVSKISIYENGSDSLNLLKEGDKCEGPLIDELKQLFLQIKSEMEQEEKEKYPEIISEMALMNENDPETTVKKYYESWDKGTFYNEGCVLTVKGYYSSNKRCSIQSKEITELIDGCTIEEYELTNIETRLIFQDENNSKVYVEYDNLNTCYFEEIGRINETVPLEKTEGGWKINELHLK